MSAKRFEYPFEKLRVWQESRILCREVYTATKSFPKSETYGLVSQMNRAAVSVAANLAEGSSRSSFRDQAHFSQIAYGSLMELACMSLISLDETFLSAETESQLRARIESVSRQLDALHKSQLARAN